MDLDPYDSAVRSATVSFSPSGLGNVCGEVVGCKACPDLAACQGMKVAAVAEMQEVLKVQKSH